MNIPQDILQQVADAAFKADNIWCRPHERRAVIQHALSNPALAPFLAGGIGEYTEEEIKAAAMDTFSTYGIVINSTWLRAFLNALPRRESPALAEAIARAEKAEANTAVNYGMLLAARERAEKAEAELSAQLGILRPIAEMPETVPEGCLAVFRWRDDFGSWVTGINKPTNGFFAILRLPDAEDTPPAKVDPYAELKAAHADGKVIQVNIGKWGNPEAEDMWEDREEPAWDIYPEFYRIKPEPAAQVPLGPEDVPPGSVLKALSWREYEWRSVSHVYSEGVLLDNCPTTHYWIELEANWQINTSIPDTGRWDATAWRPCSKPGKEVAK